MGFSKDLNWLLNAIDGFSSDRHTLIPKKSEPKICSMRVLLSGVGGMKTRGKLHKNKAEDNRSEVESVTLASLAWSSNQLNWLASCKAIGNEIHGTFLSLALMKVCVSWYGRDSGIATTNWAALGICPNLLGSVSIRVINWYYFF